MLSAPVEVLRSSSNASAFCMYAFWTLSKALAAAAALASAALSAALSALLLLGGRPGRFAVLRVLRAFGWPDCSMSALLSADAADGFSLCAVNADRWICSNSHSLNAYQAQVLAPSGMHHVSLCHQCQGQCCYGLYSAFAVAASSCQFGLQAGDICAQPGTGAYAK